MKKVITIFLIISILSSGIGLLSGCAGHDKKTVPQKIKDGIYQIDLHHVTAENKVVITKVNNYHFKNNHFLCLVQNIGSGGEKRVFVAFKNKKKFTPEFSLKYSMSFPKVGVGVHLKKLKGNGPNKVQLYEFITSAKFDTVLGIDVDGISNPVCEAITIYGDIKE